MKDPNVISLDKCCEVVVSVITVPVWGKRVQKVLRQCVVVSGPQFLGHCLLLGSIAREMLRHKEIKAQPWSLERKICTVDKMVLFGKEKSEGNWMLALETRKDHLEANAQISPDFPSLPSTGKGCCLSPTVAAWVQHRGKAALGAQGAWSKESIAPLFVKAGWRAAIGIRICTLCVEKAPSWRSRDELNELGLFNPQNLWFILKLQKVKMSGNYFEL